MRSDQKHHESEIKVDWDRPQHPRTIGAGIEWWRVSRKPDQQVLTISFKHPSFVKVNFNRKIFFLNRKILKMKTIAHDKHTHTNSF